MKKFYSIFIMAIVAAITGFQAHAETLKMNVTGADLLDFEWYGGDHNGYNPVITDGNNTIESTSFGDDKDWFSFRINPKKKNVTLTVTDNGSGAYISDIGSNSKSVYNYGDTDITVVAEEFEAVMYPVHFQFANPGTEDYIKYVYVDGENAPNFMDDDFAVMAGSKIYFQFATDLYSRDYDDDDNWCFRNGEPWNNPATGSWTAGNEVVTGETTYVFHVKPNPAFNVTFKLNNPGSAELMVNYGVSEILTQAETVKKIAISGSNTVLQIRSNGDYGLKSVKRIVEGADPVEESMNYGYYTLYFMESYGNCTYEIETASKEDLRTATCTLNIDDNASNLNIRRGNAEITDITNGDNTIKFNPDDSQEVYINISTRDYSPIYQVLVDGVKQTSSSAYSYSVKVTDGCKVEVKTVVPDTPARLTFNFENGFVDDFISSLEVAYNPIDLSTVDFTEGIEVKRGSYVKMQYNTEKYDVENVYVNGDRQYSYYSWSGTVIDDTEFTFDFHTYPTFTATINVNKPELVNIHVQNTYGDVIALNPGSNSFSYTGSYAPTLYIMAVNGGEIVSAKADGFDIRVDSYYGCHAIDMEDGMTIDIEAQGPERDKTAMFWSDLTPAETSQYTVYIASAADGLAYDYLPVDSDVNHKGGYQTFNFLDEENPFRFGYSFPYGSSIQPKIYLNNEEIAQGDNGYSFSVDQNDVVKVFIHNSAPATCAITFDVPAENAGDITVTSDRVRPEEAYTTGVNVLEGAEINIASSSDANIKGVTVDGTAVEPNDDGSYTFVASANHNVAINAESGIISIDGDDAPAEIYNLQGIRVASDLNALPAGVYIVNGKKILK